MVFGVHGSHELDDTMLSESELVQPKQLVTHIVTYLADLLSWAVDNGMEINTTKTKEMVLGRLANTKLPLPNIALKVVISQKQSR